MLCKILHAHVECFGMCGRVSTLLRLQTSLPPLPYGPLGVAGPASSLIVNLSLQGHYIMVRFFTSSPFSSTRTRDSCLWSCGTSSMSTMCSRPARERRMRTKLGERRVASRDAFRLRAPFPPASRRRKTFSFGLARLARQGAVGGIVPGSAVLRWRSLASPRRGGSSLVPPRLPLISLFPTSLVLLQTSPGTDPLAQVNDLNG